MRRKKIKVSFNFYVCKIGSSKGHSIHVTRPDYEEIAVTDMHSFYETKEYDEAIPTVAVLGKWQMTLLATR